MTPVDERVRRWKGADSVRQRLKASAAKLKADTYALYLASKDPRVPWYAKLLVGLIVAYALSPIDLIPDFIPVLGYLDDLLLIPLGVALVVRLTPPVVLESAREQAERAASEPVSYAAAIVIGAIWVLILGAFTVWIVSIMRG